MIIRFQKYNKGFTLIEMVIVIAILGTLMTIAIPQFTHNINKAKQTSKLINSQTLAGIIRIYNAEQSNKDNMLKDIIITSPDNIYPDELKERIPYDFDWGNMQAIIINEAGEVRIADFESD